jgi:hypothetical protein
VVALIISDTRLVLPPRLFRMRSLYNLQLCDAVRRDGGNSNQVQILAIFDRLWPPIGLSSCEVCFVVISTPSLPHCSDRECAMLTLCKSGTEYEANSPTATRY